MYKEKINKKDSETADEEKWAKQSKKINCQLWREDFYENSFYWKSMCTDGNHSSYSFLNYWKTTKPMALKFSDLQFVSVNCFMKNWG